MKNKLDEGIIKMQEEILRLKYALEKYANRNMWLKTKDEGIYTVWSWRGGGDPTKIARDALNSGITL